MAEILGLGVTHSPLLLGTDARMAGITEHMQQSPRLPDHIRTPSGWPAPMRHVNCYGSSTISQTGAFAHIEGSGEEIPDPPGPTAARCFGIGAATARALAASPWRMARVAVRLEGFNHRAVRGCWAAGAVELGMPGGRDGRAGAQAAE